MKSGSIESAATPLPTLPVILVSVLNELCTVPKMALVGTLTYV